MTTLKCQTHYTTTLYAYTFYGSVLGGSMAPDVSILCHQKGAIIHARKHIGEPSLH